MMASSPRAHRVLGVDPYGVATFVALLALLVGGGWTAMTTVINHDSAWYLHATKLFLHGGRLYEDIIEINPPLAFYLTVPPVWLAEVTGLFSVDVFFIWLYLLTTVSLGLSWAVLRRTPGLTMGTRRGLVFATFAALVLTTWPEMGQREHFMLIFVMPYLFLAAARVSGGSRSRGLAVAVGAFAAIGFALKPHFLLVPAVVEAYRFARTRDVAQTLRPETLTLAVFLAGYAVAVALFAPAYFTRILPWALEVYYAYSNPFLAVLWQGETIVLLATAGLYLGFRDRSAEHAIAGVFLTAAAAFYVVYIVQMTGWNYHRFPVTATAIVVLCSCLFSGIKHHATPEKRGRSVLSVLVIGWLGLMAGWLLDLGSYKNPFLEHGMRAVESQPRGSSLAVFSSNVLQAFPLVTYAGFEWTSRFPALWPLPGAIRKIDELPVDAPKAKRDKLLAIVRYTVDAVIEDLERHAPDLVIVDVRERKSYFGDRSFDYIAYFSTDPRFAALWSRYEKLSDLEGYEVYRRSTEAAPGSKGP